MIKSKLETISVLVSLCCLSRFQAARVTLNRNKFRFGASVVQTILALRSSDLSVNFHSGLFPLDGSVRVKVELLSIPLDYKFALST